MTFSLQGRNINDVFSKSLNIILDYAIKEKSRNGDVLVLPEPAAITYTAPCERVLFCPTRDANPFFHLMEALWMLAGRNDVAWPLYFNSRFVEYSDDGTTQHAAYGHRWRYHYGLDQLEAIIEELTARPHSRRAVLAMWEPTDLKRYNGKDLACNTHAYFNIRNNRLFMTVCNRSNDAIWGAFGANVVHFSILQEYLAAALKVDVGAYTQFTNNLHVYTEVYDEKKLQHMASEAYKYNYYSNKPPAKLINTNIATWGLDLENFLKAPDTAVFEDSFFTSVAQPMYRAWKERKDKKGTGEQFVEQIAAQDWYQACRAWVNRREQTKNV